MMNTHPNRGNIIAGAYPRASRRAVMALFIPREASRAVVIIDHTIYNRHQWPSEHEKPVSVRWRYEEGPTSRTVARIHAQAYATMIMPSYRIEDSSTFLNESANCNL
ncbi:hypothetical protein NC652_040957 [Populus alba x Populus x berolinensis]|nr:hypothetical protein NC652_040957 [Populus alba x Populus x berolinensis]